MAPYRRRADATATTITRVEASGDTTARSRLVAVAVAVLVSGALILVAVLAAGGSNNEQPGLSIERLGAVEAGGEPELVVYVLDRAKNRPQTSGGRARVTLECLDESGKVLVKAGQRWPFGYPDGVELDPHVHQGVGRGVESRVKRCRLAGTRPLLEGEVGGPAVR